MVDGLELIVVVNIVTPLKKYITHQRGLCGDIVSGVSFCTLPLCKCEITTRIKNRAKDL